MLVRAFAWWADALWGQLWCLWVANHELVEMTRGMGDVLMGVGRGTGGES